MNPNTQSSHDYGMWKLMAWCGPIFLATFTGFWGLLARNTPPAGADLTPAQIFQHYSDHNLALIIGMSVCMVGSAFYFPWASAVSKVMQRVIGKESLLSQIEVTGATITVAFPTIACGIWLTAALEIQYMTPEMVHVFYKMGWMIIDLAYMVTTFQIFAVSVAFLRDKREVPLVPSWVCWWGYLTCIAFFPVSLIPFFNSGPFAFHGLINFWIAFFTWYFWCGSLSYYVIKAIPRLQAEDEGVKLSPQASAVGLSAA
jgi:hypothetical protein